jgi:hypothetical protein
MSSPSNFTRVNRLNPKFAKPVVVWWSPVAARFIHSAQRHDIRAKFWHRHCYIMCAPPLLQHVRSATETAAAGEGIELTCKKITTGEQF